MIGGMTDESVAREVWKQARNAATGDKAAVVQTSALQVGITLGGDAYESVSNVDPSSTVS